MFNILSLFSRRVEEPEREIEKYKEPVNWLKYCTDTFEITPQPNGTFEVYKNLRVHKESSIYWRERLGNFKSKEVAEAFAKEEKRKYYEQIKKTLSDIEFKKKNPSYKV